MASANRNQKDKLFYALFSEKENALSLYNAVSGTSYTDVENLEIVTLEDVLYLTMRNDMALCFHDDMDLFEHQSTPNPNMPLRGFLYFAREYEGWLASHEIDIYRSTLVKIPAPKYYVMYNGKASRPEYQELKLSDAFEEKSPGYEWTAYVYNINAGHNPDLMERCETLHGYSVLIDKIRCNQDSGMNLEDAIAKATDDCIREGFLREYLLKNKGEVRDMILTEYNEELREKTLKEEGREEGREEGVSLFAKLMSILFSTGRVKDAERASSDEAFRNTLFKEFKLI